jgi:hypothetical protein
MKLKLVFLVAAIIFSACAMQKVESQPRSDNSKVQMPESKLKPSVLVELFTSEGCSSCPPADRALAFLQKEQPNSNAEIVTLAFHVDYWNYLGWKDEFSSDLFTQRQQFYARSFKLSSAYTPQMVIDGSFEVVGSNLGKVQKAISESAKNVKAEILLTKTEEKLKVQIPSLPAHQNSTIYLAIAEDNLSSNVARGENAGNRLEHISVVRQLKMLGSITAENKSFEIESVVEVQSAWKKENLKLVVFIQENQSRKILGVAYLK